MGESDTVGIRSGVPMERGAAVAPNMSVDTARRVEKAVVIIMTVSDEKFGVRSTQIKGNNSQVVE